MYEGVQKDVLMGVRGAPREPARGSGESPGVVGSGQEMCP